MSAALGTLEPTFATFTWIGCPSTADRARRQGWTPSTSAPIWPTPGVGNAAASRDV